MILRRILAAYLLVALVFAGVAGVNPFLHVLAEHGGSGQLHTHSHGGISHSHPEFSSPSVVNIKLPASNPRDERKALFEHARPFDFKGLELRQLVSFLTRAPAEKSGGAPKNSDAAGHEHHSLSAMLLAGMLDASDGHAAVELFEPSPAFVSRIFETQIQASQPAHAHAPTRGPPPLQG